MNAQETGAEIPEGMRLDAASDDDMGYVLSCIRRSVELSVSERERDLSDLWIDTIIAISEASITGRRMEDEVFVLRDSAGSYAGSVWLGRSADQFTCDDTGYILGVFVEPELRNKGIGSALLGFAESWCREKGYLHISLNVGWHNDSARRFYENHGYKVRSEVRRKKLYPDL